jgi:DNA-binding MarR family transcriptional regulator
MSRIWLCPAFAGGSGVTDGVIWPEIANSQSTAVARIPLSAHFMIQQLLTRQASWYLGPVATTMLQDPLVGTFVHLFEVYARLEQQLGQSLERDCGISHSCFEVLVALGRSEESRLTMGFLANQNALTTGGITRLIDRMETAGYVERQPSPSDRRVTYAVITRSGRRKLNSCVRVHVKNLQAAFADFSPKDLKTFDLLLDRLRLDASRG